MKPCDIFHVPHEDGFRWKWRHVGEDGSILESKGEYALFFEAVCAARESGYEPRLRAPARATS